MFTRLSNFSYGNYQIANITSTENNVDTQLLIQIQKYESLALKSILGDKFYNELKDNLELDGLYWKVKSESHEKWDWLLNGHSYVDEKCSDKQKNWKGIINVVATIQDTDVYESMLAPYIFFYYSLNTRTLNLGTGEGKIKGDNVTQESSKNKRVDAWNDFVQWVSFGFSKTDVSLYEFLNYHEELFADVEFFELNTLNYYDI